MATQRVADDDDAFVLDEGLNEADEELVAFGATDADASGGGRSAAGAAEAGGVAGGGGGPTAAKAAVADGATAPALVGAVASAAAGNANGSSREEMAGDRGGAAGEAAVPTVGAAGEAAAPTAGASAPLAAPPPPGSGLHGVVVSNVASDGHTEELLEILVCCGPMAGSAFEPLADGTLVGMALFAEAEAVDAALTLDGSRFQGRTLAVVREPSVASALTAEAALAALPGLVRQHQAALAAGTPMARDSPAAAGNDVQAALLRSVSVVGEESRKLAERIQAARLTRVAAASAADAAAATRRAWADVDAEYHVSERVSAARASAGETVATVDAQLHVRERVGDAVSVLRRGRPRRRGVGGGHLVGRIRCRRREGDEGRTSPDGRAEAARGCNWEERVVSTGLGWWQLEACGGRLLVPAWRGGTRERVLSGRRLGRHASTRIFGVDAVVFSAALWVQSYFFRGVACELRRTLGRSTRRYQD